jgi:serine/threonine-protein kinase
MPIASVTDLLDTLRRLELIDAATLDSLALETLPDDPKALARTLAGRGWLTPFQINRLFLDQAGGLRFGPFVLLEKLGEGGMGQVFKARDAAGELAALKVIRKDRLDNPDAVRRFRREIEAAAGLRDEHVVACQGAYESEGALALALEYVEGTDLARLVQKRGPLPVAEAVEYVRQAALGLQHAHERGLVHRDVKPSNLMVTPAGTVKLLDLGLARREALGETEASSTLTRDGLVLGTPDYIAPEQIEDAHGVDGRADLYALGCTLYFLLSGQVPFPGGTVARKLTRHLSEEPAALESLRPDVPGTLAGVVRKLMARRREARYPSAAAAAEALASWPRQALLAVAVPVGPPPTVTDSALQETNPFAGLHDRTEAEAVRPSAWRRWPWMAGAVVLLLAALLAWHFRPTGPGPVSVPPTATHALDLLDPADIPEDARWEGQPAELVAVLGRSRLRHPGTFGGGLSGVAFRADGEVLASAWSLRSLRLWDPRSGRLLAAVAEPLDSGSVLALAFAPSGNRLALAGDRSAAVTQGTPEGLRDVVRLAGFNGKARSVTFSPDGRWLAVASEEGKVYVWDGQRPQASPPAVLTASKKRVLGLAFSRDGALMATAGEEPAVRLWRPGSDGWVEAGQLPHDDDAYTVLFLPDGKTLAVGLIGCRLCLWDLGARDRPRAVFQVGAANYSPIRMVSPDSDTLVVIENRLTCSIWRGLSKNLCIADPPGSFPPPAVHGVAVSPDGRTVVLGYADHTLSFWDRQPKGWAERWPVQSHTQPLRALAFSEDGRGLLSLCSQRLCRWDLEDPTADPVTVYPDQDSHGLLLVPYEKQLVAPSKSSLTRWDLQPDGPPVRLPPLAGPGGTRVAYDPANETVAVGGIDQGRILFWSVRQTGARQLGEVRTRSREEAMAIAFAPEGKWMVTGEWKGEIGLWRPDPAVRWAEVQSAADHKSQIVGLAFTGPEEFVSASTDGTLRRWTIRDSELKPGQVLSEQPRSLVGLAYAPATRLLAVVLDDGRVNWFPADDWSRKKETKMPPHCGTVTAAFAPDGRHLACGTKIGTVAILRLAEK